MNKNEVFNKMSEIMTDYLRLNPDELTPESHVVDDLGADSLALVELGFKFMETFNIDMFQPQDGLLIVGNLSAHIAEQQTAKQQTT